MNLREDFDEQRWLSYIVDENGNIDKEKVMAELVDYDFILSQIPLVYCHITNSLLSKPNYYANDVISAADASYRETYTDIFMEFLKDMHEEGKITRRVYDRLVDNISDYL